MSGGKNSIMLFGVQLTEGTNNTNNSQYQQPLHQVADAISVADNVIDHASAGTSGTKRGNWTEEEHLKFLEALRQDCKGKWKTISTDFVKTRTPTQVASHAQKYYLPRPNRRGKPSVFDLTIDTDNTNMQHNQLGEMNRQGSLTSSGDLSKKTVDEDWKTRDRQQTLDTQTLGRKRVASGIEVEKTDERRIKNRESAARSRARKQAYTRELERKVSLLEEENEMIRKHNEVKSSTITKNEQIRQETVVPLPPPTPTAYSSTHNGGTLQNPLSMGLGTLLVLPPWIDLNDNGSSSSTETFPLSLKPQSLYLLDNHSSKSNGHSSRIFNQD